MEVFPVFYFGNLKPKIFCEMSPHFLQVLIIIDPPGDMMYGAEPTAFVRWGIARGAARALDGLGMLVEQAAEAFRLWRGVMPDTAPVIEALRRT